MATVKLFTLGCKVNQYEGQVIREQFSSIGYKELHNGQSADVCVINTCTVTHHADVDSLNFIRKAIKQNPKAKVIVTGCLTELDSAKIKRIKGVSLIVKNSDKHRLLKRARSQFRIFSLDAPNGHNGPTGITKNVISNFSGHTRAFLKIQDGCDNFCSYCKVPLVRGRSRSRSINEITQEAGLLVKNGFQEIVLCGICLGTYGKDLVPVLDIVDVIDELENIGGLLRIRLSSVEALDVTDELINKITGSQKLCRHLHIPLQSGSDAVLGMMNRKYTAQEYLNLVDRIRRRIPDIAITTDVMVGFPGESDKDFQDTIKLVKKILPLKAHIFPYSRREQTAAAIRFNQGVDAKIIKERSRYLQEISNSLSLDYKKRFLNKNLLVLIEEESKSKLGYWEGYTDNYLRVLFKSERRLKNKLVMVKLKNVAGDYILA